MLTLELSTPVVSANSKVISHYTNASAPDHTPSREVATEALQRLLEPSGVVIDGNRPWDPRVRDERAIREVLRRGSLGAGEAYMRGWWNAEQLDEFFYRIMRAGVDRNLPKFEVLKLIARAWLINPQTRSRAFTIAGAHYDLDDELFEAMLGRGLTYSCGYWREGDDLDSAQLRKLDTICRKLDLRSGQRILDIGCGWGSFAAYAAENYGVEVLGITVSSRQRELGQQRCRGLPVELRVQDYRDVFGTFDHVVSIGMIEHVGVKNYRAMFETVANCLSPDGLFLLHTIGSNLTMTTTDPWINRYIFPNGQLPSMLQLATASEGLFTLEDVHNLGAHYDHTLMAWYERFVKKWPAIKACYDETFFLMWTYYLQQSAGAFRARALQLWQLVYSPRGVNGGYERPRI